MSAAKCTAALPSDMCPIPHCYSLEPETLCIQSAGDKDVGGRGRGRGGVQEPSRNRGGDRRYVGGRGRGRIQHGLAAEDKGSSGNINGGCGKSYNNSSIPVFGFTRLYKFLSMPADKVILHIHDDMQGWKALLASSALKEDLLVVLISVLGQKICVEDSLHQQQVDILKSINLAERFCQQLLGVTTDIAIGSYPSWNTRPSSSTPVDHSPLTLLSNLYSMCSFVFKTMPAVTRDHAILKAVIVMCITAAGRIQDANLVDKFTALRDQVEELSKAQRVKEEASRRRQNKRGFSAQDEQEFDAETPPERIQDIVVIPSIGELRGSSEIFLRPNKKAGAYNDSSHYLDVQFRLFREDFVRPLRSGIKRFLENKNDYLKRRRMPAWEFRLYKNVTFIKVVKEFDCHVHKLQLAEQNYKKVSWSTSKRLIYGSLIILTTERRSFEEGSTHFGIIFSRNIPDLEKGIITVTWEGAPPTYNENEYLMFESEVYLESRKHTLETLKTLELDKFPLKRFIVDANPEVGPPRYLLGSDGNDAHAFQMKLANGETGAYHPLKVEEWPGPAELGFDDNQFRAFQAALTREFAIIQGPPGTGKTFLGLKIAGVLLTFQRDSRLRLEPFSPITVVCYTNYALDQFLEGILEMYEKEGKMAPDILRLGGNSRSEKMLEFSLPKVRQRKRHKRPAQYFEADTKARAKLNELEEVRGQGMDIVLGLKNLEGIANFESLIEWNRRQGAELLPLRLSCPPLLLQKFRQHFWLGINDAALKREKFSAELWIRKWFRVLEYPEEAHRPNHAQHLHGGTNSEEPQEVNELYDEEELMEHRILDEILMEAETRGKKDADHTFWLGGGYLPKHCVQSCIIETQSIMEGLTAVQDPGHRKKMEEQLRVLRNRRAVLETIFQLHRAKRLQLPNVSDKLAFLRQEGDTCDMNLDTIHMAQRWALYFAVAEEFRGEMAKMVAVVEYKLSVARKLLQDVTDWGDSFVARDCQVVGLTTTGAAKYNKLLRKLRSKIVIVEEAAQVFEAQVVTCMTECCEHLIMIGDHRQLQPNPNVYELETKYNLNLSLFERMLNNQLHCYQLKVQHRMRPDIADLIVGPIYDELLNADRVSDYPDVKGVTKNIFFLTHSEPDSCDDDLKNRSNVHEVEFLTGLCRYLILQGYHPDQINVLTTYKGQMFKLRSQVREIQSCKGVRISTVDDFQGQENDIILLSLVRSNEGNVGFVKKDNRICVALSRAKQGLFVIGNMIAMTSASDTWAQVKDKLDAKGFIGEELELVCQIHGNKTVVKCAADFLEMTPEGGCTEVCNVTLPCTHVCKRLCHTVEKEPEEHICEEKCLRMCENLLHPCKGPCYQLPCPVCHERVKKTLNCEGKHEMYLPCYKKVEEVTCDRPVEKVPACNVEEHKTMIACNVSIYDYDCKAIVIRSMPGCGHPKEMKCHEDPTLKKCRQPVTNKLPHCEHEQTEECWRWELADDIFCVSPVLKKPDYCDHAEVLVKCGDREKPVNCQEKCEFGLPCGHACVKKCHGDKDPEHLTVKCYKQCEKSCALGHECKSVHKCWTACPPCKELVDKSLPSCGHNMKLACHDFTNETYKCMRPCESILPGALCRHLCPNLCYEKCGPCKEKVTKRAPCRHGQEVLCSEPAKKENCMELIPPKNLPVCGHRGVKFPCKYEDASPEELARLCTQPCDHILISADETGCSHQCSGTCSECRQGRVHKKCQEKCGRSLVCGHRCDVPCSKACPPCQKPCGIKCEHSKWRKKCGDYIPDCKEPCKWKCEHKRCTKRCGDMCDRDPCDEPCPKKRKKCGHDCIGFCGEPCPPLCRVCDREELEEELANLAVEEDVETARFVFLRDCRPNGHTIEVNALQKWFTDSKVEDDGRVQIGMKTCPLHQNPIYDCRRFGNVIRSCYKDAREVKKKALGNMKASNKLRDSWIQKFQRGDMVSLGKVFPQHSVAIKNLLLQEARGDRGPVSVPRSIDEYSMKSLDFITNSVTKVACDLLDLFKKGKFKKDVFDEVVTVYGKMFGWMLARQPLSHQEKLDFNVELDRTDLFKQLMMRASLDTCNPQNGLAYPKYLEAQGILGSTLPLTVERKAAFVKVVKELDEILRSGLGITNRERQEIVSAMGLGRGHWFKCPNGHIYAIGDCGGANQGGTCNICRAPIGGVSHQLARGNQLATEMDGATTPAYPTALMRYN